MLSATSELSAIGLFSEKETAALASAGFLTTSDLLGHFPTRYEDRRRFDAFPTQPTPAAVCLRGNIIDTALKFSGGGRGYFDAVVQNDTGGVFGSGKITCRWFGMPYLRTILAAGMEVILFGKVKEFNGRLIIDHPEFEILREDDPASIHVERVVPIYRNVSGIAQRRLRETIYALLAKTDLGSLPAGVDLAGEMPRQEALRGVHFPDSLEAATTARRRFALEEFFLLQLNVVWRRTRHAERSGRVLGRTTTSLKRFHASLPFELTGAQKRAIKEILADMRSERPMNRLLQGDVGAGKTFVAMAAMLLAIDSGCQAALMAPTQILAEQHFLTFRRWLEPLGIRIALRTGNREEASDSAEPQIVIGTHALLYGTSEIRDLGLVVIDEQHKFGVGQRATLIQRGIVPDVLVMTATPIPRTLTMTVYGDLDVSLLDEKPPGRGKIVTVVRAAPKQSDVTKFVKDKLAEGRQAYLVYPLVGDGESAKAEGATEAFGKWAKRLGPNETGLIHGKLRSEEKESVMRRFREGEISALVATSVIEVGVDVPNANVMILHQAERFGLAQLHQLRGRIGRGEHKSYCILLTDGKNPDAMEKLQILARTSDGFEIAEADLAIRGPGDVLGTMQSGVSELRFADFLADTALLHEARALADKVFAEDPRLIGDHAALRKFIVDAENAAPLPGTA